MICLAQLSDPHVARPEQAVLGEIDTAEHLRRAVATLLALPQRPDALVITGDLTESGHPDEYRQLAALLAPLPMPCHVVAGNHDERHALRAVFTDRLPCANDRFVQFAADIGSPNGPCLLALDTVDAGHGSGRLCDVRLAWLEDALRRYRDRRVVVAMHHPPIDTGIAEMDLDGLVEGRQCLQALLLQHPAVDRVICGHVHRSITVAWAGTVVTVAPSPAHQIALDLDPAATLAWVREPPGLLLHVWAGHSAPVTHLVPIGNFGPAHPYD